MSGHAGQERDYIPRSEELERENRTRRRDVNVPADLIHAAAQHFAEQAGLPFARSQIHDRGIQADACRIEVIDRDDRRIAIRVQQDHASVVVQRLGHLREEEVRISLRLSFNRR